MNNITEKLINEFLEAESEKYQFDFCAVDMGKIEDGIEAGEISLPSILSEAEIEYLEKLKLLKNKIQWISGRCSVKSALFRYKFKNQVLMDLTCIDVLKGADSAPYFLQYPDLNISITHSYQYCIGMVCPGKIGVDIEKIFQPREALISRYFSHGEKEILARIKDPLEHSTQATVYWTRKEAVSKLLRLGMKMNFREVDTSEDEVYLPEVNNTVKLVSCVCGDFCLSIAVE